MYIANIAFKRAKPNPEYKSFGAIWFDKEKHHCALLLKGIRQGQFMAKPFDKIAEPPYLAGDIMVWTGSYIEHKDIPPTKDYLWCGWIWTCTDSNGVIYNGVLEVDPMPVMLMRKIRDVKKEHPDVSGKETGIMLNVQLEDK